MDYEKYRCQNRQNAKYSQLPKSYIYICEAGAVNSSRMSVQQIKLL